MQLYSLVSPWFLSTPVRNDTLEYCCFSTRSSSLQKTTRAALKREFTKSAQSRDSTKEVLLSSESQWDQDVGHLIQIIPILCR